MEWKILIVLKMFTTENSQIKYTINDIQWICYILVFWINLGRIKAVPSDAVLKDQNG